MKIEKFNLDDFVTNEDWSMKALLNISDHWVEGVLIHTLDDGFNVEWYDLDFDCYKILDFEWNEIKFYIPLD